MAARVVPIESADDPRLVPFSQIRERDLAGRTASFIVEGKFALRVLVDRGKYPVRALLLAENRVDAVRDVVDRLPESVEAYVVPQRAMDALVGFHIHRGILALAERAAVPSADELLDEMPDGPCVVVGLLGILNHDNVGGIFRNAAAFGAGCALLDPVTCDPLYRKAIRVSAGAALFVPFARSSSAHVLVDALARRGFEVWGLSPGGEVDVDALPRGGRVGLLLGTEGEGLSEEILRRVRTVKIPMAPGFDSLNVAVASGIALHAVTRAAGPSSASG